MIKSVTSYFNTFEFSNFTSITIYQSWMIKIRAIQVIVIVELDILIS